MTEKIEGLIKFTAVAEHASKTCQCANSEKSRMHGQKRIVIGILVDSKKRPPK